MVNAGFTCGRRREEPGIPKWKREPALAGGYLALPGAIATVSGASRGQQSDSISPRLRK
jgi:hypothetical protein